MASSEPPFDEREQRWLLAEILKVSPISPLELIRFIGDKGITPNWVEMLIPNGTLDINYSTVTGKAVRLLKKHAACRSVSACMRAYESLLNPPSAPISSVQPGGATEQSTSAAKAGRKRPPQDEGPLTPGDRTIQAHHFAAVNTFGDPTHHYAAPLHPTTGEPPQKKRGRPSKEEHERRVREAAERGEVYPPPKKAKVPRHSLEGAQSVGNAAMATPDRTEAGTMEEGSTNKKKAKKAKPDSSAMHLAPDPPARISSLEATARAADRMQIDTEEAVKSTIPETQPSDSPAQEILLAGVREHIARGEAENMESSSTLKHESAPRSELRTYSATSNNNDRTDPTQNEEAAD